MSSDRLKGPLRAGELAEAAVLANLSALLVVLGWLMPQVGLMQAVAVTPFAALAFRRRFRAVFVGMIAAMAVAFLVAGPPPATQVLLSGLFGHTVGVGVRRGWGRPRTVLLSLVTTWLPAAMVTVGVLVVLSPLRILVLKQIDIGWRGTRRIFTWVGLARITPAGDAFVRGLIRYWWLSLTAAELLIVVGSILVARLIALPALRRLEEALGRPVPGPGLPPGPPGPVPVTLEAVTFRYPGVEGEALRGVSLTVAPATFVGVLGPNGSGKSTLARVLAGLPPSRGRVIRPGHPAPGRPGGTAVISQRPESQVLGVRVAEDVLWGLPRDHGVDVDGILERVGLAAFAGRETATLSGGELQRLAIAAALARRPALLISDESTAMLDRLGRAAVAELLHSLPAEGVAVVHITHHPGEVEGADQVIVMDRGRISVSAPP